MDTILTHVLSVYDAVLAPFGSPDFGPKLATGLLALSLLVLVAFLGLTLPQAFRLRAALNVIRGQSDKGTEQEKRAAFHGQYQAIDAALLSNKTTTLAWQEFRKTLIFRGDPQRAILLASSRPQNFFNPRNLLIQYEFVRSLPNFFVGLGLLGTFIGLIAALTFSTRSLTAAVDQEQIKAALNQLLTTAAAKFYISAAGLVASLVLSISIRLVLKYLSGQVHRINNALEERLLFVTEQNITERQLSVQQESLEELKLFNTNIAMKIGDAVRSAVEDSNNSLTTKLSAIADSFAKLVDASGEGASKAIGEAMRGAFDDSLKQASQAIGAVSAQLKDLPSRLEASADSISGAGKVVMEQQQKLATTIQEMATSTIQQAGSQMVQQIDQGTRNLLTKLGDSGETFEATATKISVLFDHFGERSNDYLKSLSSLTDQNSKLEVSLGSLSSRMIGASEAVTTASSAIDANLGKLLNAVSDLTRAATETSHTVRDSQAAITATVDTLQQQMTTHLRRFDSVDEKLAAVFSSIASHLELQSKQMGEQLTTMDQALARAVNEFAQLIDDLTTAMSTRQAAE
jgi:hypothetical protein